MKFLLSTGKSTDRIEVYVIDLFKLYLNIMPGDIPGTDLGFDFVLTDTLKSNLANEIRNRVSRLVNTIQKKFDEKEVSISVSSLDIISDEKVKLVVSVNKTTSEEIVFKYT
jgi:methionyl-tRNA synthetase